MQFDHTELEDYYENSILPQFKVSLKNINWDWEKTVLQDPDILDEDAHCFSSGGKEYILLWDDSSQGDIKAHQMKGYLGLELEQFKFIDPVDSKYSPSIATPKWTPEANFVGWFTLLELK